MRRMFVVLIAVALAVGVFVFWPRADGDDPPITLAEGTTTTSQALNTTTSAASSTTSVGDASHIVETPEEAEEILRSHYYSWFLGIFDQDESLIRSVVLLDSQVQAAVDQFGQMPFESEPTREGLRIQDVEILRADDQCLAIWSALSSDFRTGESAGVAVFRYDDGAWKLLSTWSFREDLWEEDCDSSL